MRFRHLYWVTEQLSRDGDSGIGGVYTSIHDLLEKGVQWHDGVAGRARFRLNLVLADSDRPSLGSWCSPEFPGLEQDLQEYVRSDEMTTGDVEALASELRAFFRRGA